MGIKKRTIKELELHSFWKSLPYEQVIYTQDQQKLTIVNLGKYNRSRGPDFFDAHLRFNNQERFGDIEIHVEENDWHRHEHTQDERYNKVILHVFLERYNKIRPAFNAQNQKIPAWQIPKNLWEQFINNSNQKPRKNYILGVCGLLLKENIHRSRLQRFIIQSAQMRLEKKSAEYQSWQDNHITYNQILYQAIARALGYTAYKYPFFNLARYYDYARFYKNLKTYPLSDSFIDAMGHWLSYLDLFEQAKKQFEQWKPIFQEMQNKPIKKPNNDQLFIPEKMSILPNFNPILRLLLFYFHNYNTSEKQLFHTWYLLLKKLQSEFVAHKIIREVAREKTNDDPQEFYPHRKTCQRLINQAIKSYTALFHIPVPLSILFSKTTTNY